MPGKPFQTHGGILWVVLCKPRSWTQKSLWIFCEPINKPRVGMSDFGCEPVSPCHRKAGIKLEMWFFCWFFFFCSLALPGDPCGGEQPPLKSEGRDRGTSRAFFPPYSACSTFTKVAPERLAVFMSLLTSPGCIYCA